MIDNLVKTLAELEVLGVKVSEPHLPGIAKLHKKLLARTTFSVQIIVCMRVYTIVSTPVHSSHTIARTLEISVQKRINLNILQP